MSQNRITIDPVTRLEGHGKITVNLDSTGQVEDAFFSVAEFRGFEKFCEGRMLWEMPTITSRICGVCPVSHHLASVKAAEAVLDVEPPSPAVKLRELMHMGQTIHSHALHFFFFALPDFIHSESAPIEHRSVLGLLANSKAMAQDAIILRKAGQTIVDTIGGGRLHPVTCIPGGMSQPLGNYDRIDLIRALMPAMKIAQKAMKMAKDLYQKNAASFTSFASFPSYYMGLTKNDALELYDGDIRIADAQGATVKDFSASDYLKNITEKVDERSWTKHPHYLADGGNQFYRVAPLARLNIAKSITTPLADAELKEFKAINDGKPIEGIMMYHYARMIELLYCVEKAKELLMDPEIMSTEVRVPAKRKSGEGVGVLEAPRGTLFHHYTTNDDGRLTKVNIIVSTAHNHTAMNESLKMIAKTIVKDGAIPENSLNRLEMGIRCFDPCLSCSSHSWGKMPLLVEVKADDGKVISSYKYGDMG